MTWLVWLMLAVVVVAVASVTGIQPKGARPVASTRLMGMPRLVLLGLQLGTIELTLDCPMDGHGRNACVSLHVTDADAYYREWSAKVTSLRSPKNEEWGARTFDLLDPSGNTLFVIGPVR